MKRFLILILGLVLGVQAFGQGRAVYSNHGDFYVGAGYANSIIKNNDPNNRYTLKIPGNGFYFGMGYEFPSTSDFTFNVGLDLLTFRYNFDYGYYMTETALRAPFRVNYTNEISRNVELVLFTGPVAACSIGGEEVEHYGSVYTERSLSGGDFDIMYGFGGGVTLSDTIRIVCSYDFGLVTLEDYTKRDFFTIGVNYIF